MAQTLLIPNLSVTEGKEKKNKRFSCETLPGSLPVSLRWGHWEPEMEEDLPPDWQIDH